MKIAIVNKDTEIIQMIKNIAATQSHCRVIWTTNNLKDTLQKYQKEIPDLILIDLTHNSQEGLEIITQIMKIKPCAIIVTIASNKESTPLVFKAMGSGALDVIELPHTPIKEDSLSESLISKFQLISKLLGKNNLEADLEHKKCIPQLLIIGASTGGPLAISKIVSKLPKSFPCCCGTHTARRH